MGRQGRPLKTESVTRKVGCAAEKDDKVVVPVSACERRYMFLTRIRSR